MSALSDIQARKTGFYFRKAIPSELRPHFGGKREIVRSLGTDSAKARVKGRELSLHLERLIIAARERGISAPVSPQELPLRARAQKAGENQPPAKPVILNLSQAFLDYQAERRLPPILQHLETREVFYDQMERDPTPMRGIAMGMPALDMQECFAFWLLTGILEEFPRLKVVMVEPGLGWLPFLFETILDGRIKQGHYKFPKLKMLPSEYFKGQMGATFMNEPQGLKIATDYFGPDAFYWSTDFPHPATCWPNSRETIEHQFAEAGLSAEDRYKIVCGNGMRTFGFE